jgi:MoaA/NifB/PqqE/SkfB family radical SAM enzyme
VVDNVKALTARRRAGGKGPRVLLQFLVWKENYRSIPRMYELAREMGADQILFNGLAYLQPEQHMSEAETEEMMALYEEVVRRDEFRRIGCINSFEQDLTARVDEMKRRIGAARGSLPRRLLRFAARGDFPLRERLAHLARRAGYRRMLRRNAGLEAWCLIAWHSLVVRTTGMVAPCCILQGKELGNVYRQSLREVWHGEPYASFRRELSRILREGEGWQHDPAADRVVDGMCGKQGACPIGTFYYWPDHPFLSGLGERLVTLRGGPA